MTNQEKLLKLRKLLEFQANPNLAQFETAQMIAEALAVFKTNATTLKGDKGDQGEPGQDADETKIVQAVMARIRIPRDGRDAEVDYERIIRNTLARIPKPRDGRDAEVDYDRILLDVLSQLPEVHDGKDGKDGKDGVNLTPIHIGPTPPKNPTLNQLWIQT